MISMSCWIEVLQLQLCLLKLRCWEALEFFFVSVTLYEKLVSYLCCLSACFHVHRQLQHHLFQQHLPSSLCEKGRCLSLVIPSSVCLAQLPPSDVRDCLLLWWFDEIRSSIGVDRYFDGWIGFLDVDNCGSELDVMTTSLTTASAKKIETYSRS